MKNVYVGKIVATHGIKGEVKILSDFQFKDKVFRVGNKLSIDEKLFEIKTYRHHKNFEMVTLDDYRDINEVLFLMKKKVYIDEDSLNLNDEEVLDEELVNYDILTTTGEKGSIKEIFFASSQNKIMRVQLEREVLIPLNSPMIKKINKKNKEVIIELIEGM